VQHTEHSYPPTAKVALKKYVCVITAATVVVKDDVRQRYLELEAGKSVQADGSHCSSQTLSIQIGEPYR